MGFGSVALLQAHQRIPAVHDYYVPDLVELCGLAAMVREEVDDLAIPLAPTDRAPFATFERFMRRRRPQLVGISVFTAGARSAAGYAEIAKRHGAFVVLGGYHPSALPDEVLAAPHVDAVVRGSGGADLRRAGPPRLAGGRRRDLVPRRRPHRAQPGPPGIADARRAAAAAARAAARAVRPHRARLPHRHRVRLARLPRPLRVLRQPPRRRQLARPQHRRHRGRAREPDPPRRGPWKYVKFWDSTFLADAERVAELCRSGCAPSVSSATSASSPRPGRRTSSARRRSSGTCALPGFVRIGCGVESPSRETHRELGKGLNLAHVGQAAVSCARANMQMTKFLIVGHEHETADDILAYPDYALRDGVKLHNTTFFVMTPYPGTDLARDYHQKGLVDSRDWDLYTNFGAVVAPGRLSSWRLQVLHAAVCLRYGVTRRFLAGGSSAKTLAKALEPLLLLAAIGAARRDLTPDEVAAAVSDAVQEAATEVCRDARPGRPARARRALVIHAPGRAPVIMAVLAEGDRERLVIGTADRLPPGRRRLAVHLQAAELVSLAVRIDYRRLTADALTLAYTPRAVRLRSLAGLAHGAGTMLATLARVGAFTLRCAVGGSGSSKGTKGRRRGSPPPASGARWP
jgi:anaerobic magnesium-protoporphyrin IX monomethyl ester cyclase